MKMIDHQKWKMSSTWFSINFYNLIWVCFQQMGLGIFPEDLVNLEVLILRNSSGLIRRLNSPVLQNHKELQKIDLSFLELVGLKTLSPNIFQSLNGLKNLIMHKTRINGPLIFIRRPTPLLKSFQQQLFNGEFFNEKSYLIPQVKVIDLSQSLVDKLVVHGYDDLEILNLEEAEIGDLFLSDLPSLGSLNFHAVKMGKVYFSGMKTSSVPEDEKYSLNKIEALNFSNSEIGTLNLTSVNSLRFVDLSHANVTNLLLSELESLETLNLANSRVSKLFLLDLPTLKKLDLSQSNVKQFNISGLKKLQILDMSSIQLEMSFGLLNFSHFPSLVDLNLSFSNIFEIPKNCFANLKFLRSLNLSHNLLDELPQSLFGTAETSELNSVDLSDNYLRTLSLENFKAIITGRSDWTINLDRNLIDCSDCANAWLSNMDFHFNLKGALCKSPFGKYNISVSAADICSWHIYKHSRQLKCTTFDGALNKWTIESEESFFTPTPYLQKKYLPRAFSHSLKQKSCTVVWKPTTTEIISQTLFEFSMIFLCLNVTSLATWKPLVK